MSCVLFRMFVMMFLFLNKVLGGVMKKKVEKRYVCVEEVYRPSHERRRPG